MKRRRRLPIGLLPGAAFAVVVMLAGATTRAADESEQRENGKMEFLGHCAACHGQTGLGNGPVAEVLLTAPANLTEIKKRNGGVFPVDDVYRIIDGRIGLWAHGNQEMPVWGQRFRFEAIEQLAGQHDATDPEVVVRERIMSLVAYLESIQVD